MLKVLIDKYLKWIILLHAMLKVLIESELFNFMHVEELKKVSFKVCEIVKFIFSEREFHVQVSI